MKKCNKSLGLTFETFSCEDYKKVDDIMTENKERFFELFSKWFYSLWD